MAHHIEVSKLPTTVQTALKSVGYGKRDIAVHAAESVRLESAYGDGYRAFAVVLDMGTGESRTLRGSWGGAHAYALSQVDNDEQPHAIPLNGAVITGQEGGGRPVSARLCVRPDAMPALLPASGEVTERQRDLLAIFGGIKGGHRAEYLARAKATDDEINALIAAGYIKRNAAGATQITTAGKNARGNAQVRY